MIKTIVLGSALTVTLSFVSTGLQGNTPAPLLEEVLGITDQGAECVSIDDSTVDLWNVGNYCLASAPSKSTSDSTNASVANDLPISGLQLPDGTLEDSSLINGLRHNSDAGSPMITKCVSGGGSTAAAAEGFCLGADLSTSKMGLAHFSVTNSLPATGLQYLQVTFRDGSTLSGSRPLTSGVDAAMFAECESAGGSTAATGGEFCLSSDLITLTRDLASFSIANGLPAAGLQFLQITFSGRSPRVFPDTGAPMGTECSLVGGSTATTANAGGFCMVSDLSTPTTDYVANFSVANDLPVVGMHFLQMTFEDASPQRRSRRFQHLFGPSGAQCVSVDGSSAAIATTGGSCLTSDLGRSTTDYAANFSVANGLAIAGMQYVQATFGNGNPLVESGHSPSDGAPRGAECLSVDGSIAATGNPEGFCLIADRGRSKIGFANFSVANHLPVANMRILQVPFGDGRSRGRSRFSRIKVAPVGVTVSDFETLPFYYPPSPNIVIMTGHRPRRHFHNADPTRRFRPYIRQRRQPFLALRLGCESREPPVLAKNARWGLLHRRDLFHRWWQQRTCVQSRVRWGRLRI